jgi:hypothetical protein
MSRGLIARARLALVAAAIAVAAIACATATPGAGEDAAGDNNAQSTTTTVPAAATNTAEPQEGGEQQEPAPVAEQDITGALFLQLDSPASTEMFVSSSRLEVAGHTTVDALLSINDAVVEVDGDGKFAFAVELTEGPNLVEVVASNALGEQFDEVLLVIYEPA